MGLMSRIFGSDKIVDAGIKGIDAMVFTDEEKSNVKLAFLKAYEPFKLAQRYLALLITLLIVVFAITGITFVSLGRDVDQLLDLFSALNLDLSSALIYGFYFGGGAAEGIIKSFSNNRNNKG